MMIRLLLIMLMVLMAGCAGKDTASTSGSDKVALVIGNSAYQHTTAIPNPANDANDLAASLEDLGFHVIKGIDLDQQGLNDAVAEFSSALKGSDVGLFFYAGHGIQIDGMNYMVPVDALLDDGIESTEDMLSKVYLMDKVLKEMSDPDRISLVFLDACRNNPMVASLDSKTASRSIKVRRKGTGSVAVKKATIHRGLAEVNAASSRNMFIAYATQPGNIAVDGDGRNSPFTASLVEYIDTPGLEVRQLLTGIRKVVMSQTGGAQVPWDHASLTTQFYFKKKGRVSLPPP
ncbi:MAG: caspase domain-containing protein [Mariprofundaceae bacterium]